MKRFTFITLSLILIGCVPQAASMPTAQPSETPARAVPTPGQSLATLSLPTVTPEATETQATEPTVQAAPSAVVDEETAWMSLPILPEPDVNIREIYQRGLALGNDPNAFSIFGDCQAEPQEFLGIYDIDSALVASLAPELQEAVANFAGSFDRESPTARDGTTPGALLWTQWHRGKLGCTFSETPVECELRIHRPSFVIIQIGSHFESRNTEYLRRVITQLIDNGVVPILATKADNREKDHRVNRDMAMLSAEFDLPLWNFWAALSDLPKRGLYVMEGREFQGAIYLNEEAKVIHRQTGLEALNIVWRTATGQ